MCARRGRWRRRRSGSAPRARRGRAPRPGRARPRGSSRTRSGTLGGKRAQVEPDVLGAVGVHAVEDRRGHLVAWRQLVGEPPPARVEERRALAPHGLGDEGSVVLAPGRASAVGWNWQSSRSASLAPAACARTAAGPDRAPGVRRARPERRAATRRQHRRPRADRAAVGDEAAAALAIARQRERRGALDHVDQLVGRGELGEPRSQRAPGLGAAGVDDPPRAVAALQAERERAVGLEVERDPARDQRLDRRREPPGRASRPPLAAEAAARVQRVLGVALRGVVGSEGGGEPSLCPVAGAVGERLARDDARARAALRGLQRDVKSRGAAPTPRRRTLRPSRRGYGSRDERGDLSPPPALVRARDGLAPENTRRIGAIEARSASAGLARARAPSRRRRRRASRSSASIPPEHVDAIETFCERGGGMIDLDTVACAARFEAALRAAGRRRRRGRAAARRRGRRRLLRPAPAGPPRRARPGDGLLPLQQRRGRRRARDRRACGAERVLILDWDVHHGNGTEEIFDESADVLYASIHQSPLYPAPAPPGTRARARGRATRSTCRCRPGAGADEFLALVAARRRPDRARVRARPDRDLGGLRRPPRRPARAVRGRRRRLRAR